MWEMKPNPNVRNYRKREKKRKQWNFTEQGLQRFTC